MLALDRPLGIVSDLALFADHADPTRVYYVPARPQLARIGSAQEMAFVKFRASDAEQGGAGLLSFTTELVASDAQLERAREHLERAGVSEPLLAQVPTIGDGYGFHERCRLRRLVWPADPSQGAGGGGGTSSKVRGGRAGPAPVRERLQALGTDPVAMPSALFAERMKNESAQYQQINQRFQIKAS